MTTVRALQMWVLNTQSASIKNNVEMAVCTMQEDHRAQRDAQEQASNMKMEGLQKEHAHVMSLKEAERNMLEEELEYTRDLLHKLTLELEETIANHELQDQETNVMYNKAMDKNKEG